MRSTTLALSLGCLLTVATTGRARAQAQEPTVAIVVENSVNVNDSELTLLTSSLVAALRARLQVRPIDPAATRARLPDREADCLAKTSCLQQVVAAVDADDILSLVILRVGDNFQIETTWIDGRTGGLGARPTVRIPVASSNLEAAFSAHVGKLLPHRKAASEQATPATSSPSRIPVWISLGVSAAGLATGLTLGTIAWRRYNDCDDLNNRCRLNEIDDLRSLELKADIALGIGIAAGLTAAGLYWLTPSEESPAISAAVGDHGATVVWTGRF